MHYENKILNISLMVSQSTLRFITDAYYVIVIVTYFLYPKIFRLFWFNTGYPCMINIRWEWIRDDQYKILLPNLIPGRISKTLLNIVILPLVEGRNCWTLWFWSLTALFLSSNWRTTGQERITWIKNFLGKRIFFANFYYKKIIMSYLLIK